MLILFYVMLAAVVKCVKVSQQAKTQKLQ